MFLVPLVCFDRESSAANPACHHLLGDHRDEVVLDEVVLDEGVWLLVVDDQDEVAVDEEVEQLVGDEQCALDTVVKGVELLVGGQASGNEMAWGVLLVEALLAWDEGVALLAEVELAWDQMAGDEVVSLLAEVELAGNNCGYLVVMVAG